MTVTQTYNQADPAVAKYDLEHVESGHNTDNSGDGNHALKRNITVRQMAMMAMGTSIGAGLFFGTGEALSAGGPGFTLLAFAIAGAVVVCTMLALGEMAATYPIAGAFYDYTVRFVDPAWGFAMGWNYVINWLIVLPFELTVIGSQLQYWYPAGSKAHMPWSKALVFIGLLIPVCVIALNGSSWFARVEQSISMIKVITIVTFILVSIVIASGGVKSDPRGHIGSKYWHEPGSFLRGIRGFFTVFKVAGLAYGGTEVLGLTAAECRNPSRMLPLAAKITMGRIAFLFLLTLVMLGFVLPATYPDLKGNTNTHAYSPMVLAMEAANIKPLAHIFCACIILAIYSMTNVASFASSRALQALCAKGMGPAFCARVNSKGLPYGALVVSLVMSLIVFVGVVPAGGAIFDWLLSLTGVSNFMTWLLIGISHIRLRRALRRHGIPSSALAWKSRLGEAGSWFVIIGCIFSITAQIVSAILPARGGFTIANFFQNVLGVFVVLIVYVGYQIWHYIKFRSLCYPKPITRELVEPKMQAPIVGEKPVVSHH